MLTLLLSVLVNVGGYSQSFTPVEYNFPNNPGKFTSRTNPIYYDFISSASNGYGTWAVDGEGHWYLLSDSLSTESTSSSAPVPSGVVETGSLVTTDANIEQTKVVANLVGNVRFVSLNSTLNGFVIQGFNDERASNPAHRNIDISFVGIPNQTDSRKIIKLPIVVYPPITIQDGGTVDVLDLTAQGTTLDFRDVFDVSIDAEHLYIVWQSEMQDSASKVNVTIVKLSDGSVINNTFPKQLGTSCVRPTIACNVRNTSPAAFYSAMIKMDYQVPINNRVIYSQYNGNTLNNSQTISTNNQTKFIDPRITDPDAPPLTLDFKYPKHARVVVSSTKITTNTMQSKMGIYIIGNGAGLGLFDGGLTATLGDDIVLYYKNDTRLRYVDGSLIDNHPAPLGNNTAFFIPNVHIRAFANPYDGKDGIYNEELHCLYQLDDDRVGTPLNQKKPLLIIRGANNGSLQYAYPGFALPLITTTSTRTVLTKELDPQSDIISLPSPKLGAVYETVLDYIASVNQKGIHVYWEGITDATADILFYQRDYRFLDEPIEENTLLTFENTITNGTSHGGTIDAKLMPGRIMTLWTDPNFDNGVLYTSSLAQIGWQNARLKFVGENVRLDIGETTIPVCSQGGEQTYYYPCSTTWAKLVMLPNTEIRFQDECARTNNQVLSINPGSTLEFYGVPTNLGKSNILGAGTVNFSGQGNVGPLPPNMAWSTPNIVAPAHLNIHGGATFVVPNSVLFTANKASIDCLFEPNVTTIGSTTNATGLFKHHGTAELSNSYFKGHNTSSTAVPILNVVPSIPINTPFIPSACTLPAQQWRSENVEYVNTPNTGQAKLLCNGTTPAVVEKYRNVSMLEGYMKAVQLDIQDPVENVEVDGVIFSKTKNTAINIQRTLTRTYAGIDVKNNAMTYDAQDVNGINIEGFDTRRTSTFDLVFVDNNTLTSTASAPTLEPFGIQIKNTDAKVTNNEITGAGFFNGIVVDGAHIPGLNGTTTFICTNTVEEVTGNGIFTTDWKGYAFLNTVSGSGVGHLHGGSQDGNIFFSTYQDNLGAGLKVIDGKKLFLNKLNDGTYNISGNNTIVHNNQAGGTGQMQLENFSQIFLGTNSSGNSAGDNNIIANNATTDLFGYTSQTTGTGGYIRFERDPNYWATGSGNGTLYTMSANNDPMFGQLVIQFYDAIDAQHTSIVTPPSFRCGEGYIPQQIQQPKSSDHISEEECDKLSLKINGYSGSFQDQLVYDSTMFYIEHCYNELGSWSYFSTMGSSVSYLVKNSKVIVEDYREWLKSVLYLNPDSLYYCNAALEIARSFLYADSTSGRLADEAATVCRFLLDSAQCSFLRPNILSALNNIRYNQYKKWKDTVTDSIATPYSPGYTTLEALDLTLLRGFKNAVNADLTKPLSRNPISEARAIPNPITDEVELWYKLTEGALVKIEVFDALGKQMYSMAQGYKPIGESRLNLDTRSWSNGSYYARFTTLGGEVKTIKLVKE